MAGMLSSLFGGDPKQYARDGYELTQSLVRRFSLPEWKNGRPQTSETDSQYLEAILASFQNGSREHAESKGMESESFHPEFWAIIERSLIDCALRMEASENPNSESWRGILSLYLRAWSSAMNPWAMLAVAEILFGQKERADAKTALRVCSLSSTYWRSKTAQEVKLTMLAYGTIRDYVPQYRQSDLRDHGFDLITSTEMDRAIEAMRKRYA